MNPARAFERIVRGRLAKLPGCGFFKAGGPAAGNLRWGGFGTAGGPAAANLSSGGLGKAGGAAATNLSGGGLGKAGGAAANLSGGAVGKAGGPAVANVSGGAVGKAGGPAVANVSGGAVGKAGGPAAANLSGGAVGKAGGAASANLSGGGSGKAGGAAAARLSGGGLGKAGGPAAAKLSGGGLGKAGGPAAANLSGGAVGKAGGAAAANLSGGAVGKAGGQAVGKLAVGKVLAGTAGKLMLILALLPVGLILAGVAWLSLRSRKPKAPAPLWRRERKKSMRKLIAGRAVLLMLLIVSAILIGIGASTLYERLKVHNIALAAGSSKAESYVLMQALQTVVQRDYPRLKITVHETGGTTDSLERLDRGEAQLAAAQSDVAAPASALAVAVLFEDTFQLLVHKNSTIGQFTDLKGKKIGLPKTGGQYKSFLFLASHFGLKEPDFTFVGGDDEGANLAFARNEADAIFQVRPLHNASIAQLASGGDAVFLPIENASAMHVESPAYMAAILPKGLYVGNPPVPATDLPTLSTQRLLLARADVDAGVITTIVKVLMERRQELAAAIPDSNKEMRPLVSQLTQPVVRAGLGPAPHPGATAYYNREQSSFVASHSDSIALILAGFVLIGLWISELRRSTGVAQKDRANEYNMRIVELMEEIQASGSDQELAPIHAELMSMLTKAVRDLDEDKLSEESFQSFHTVWRVAIDLLRDRKPAAAPPEPTVAVAVADARESKPAPWSLGRFLQAKSGQQTQA